MYLTFGVIVMEYWYRRFYFKCTLIFTLLSSVFIILYLSSSYRFLFLDNWVIPNKVLSVLPSYNDVNKQNLFLFSTTKNTNF